MTLQIKDVLAGKLKVYEDPDATPENIKHGYKGYSYMGNKAICVPKDGNNQLVDPQKQMVYPKDGDQFIVEDCMFGDVFTVRSYHKAPPNPDGSIALSKYREAPEGPPNAFLGMSDRGVGTSLEKDPERGWIAVGYWFCPHVPPVIDPHESESKRMREDTKKMVKRWDKTKLMDGLDPNSHEAIMTAALLENQLAMGHGTCGGWGC